MKRILILFILIGWLVRSEGQTFSPSYCKVHYQDSAIEAEPDVCMLQSDSLYCFIIKEETIHKVFYNLSYIIYDGYITEYYFTDGSCLIELEEDGIRYRLLKMLTHYQHPAEYITFLWIDNRYNNY